MRFLVSCTCFVLFIPTFSSAQYFFYNDKYIENILLLELGAGVGAMNCLTDLGGNKGIGRNFIKDVDLSTFRASFHIAVFLNFKEKFTARLQFTTGKIHSSDNHLQRFPNNSGGRYYRNLSFNSDIEELMLLLDVYPVTIGNGTLAPYISAGLSIFHFSPMTKLDGRWYHLQPLRTEGQGIGGSVPYDLTQIALPVAAGFRLDLSARLRFRIEFIHRKLFTDYLDDVSTEYVDPQLFFDHLPISMALVAHRLHDRRAELDPNALPAIGQQRGDPSDNDSWFTIGLTVSYTFRSRR